MSAQADVDRLKITEIFFSIQGESSTVGWPTTFVRLTGCPLRCGYCDTAYAFHGGQWMSIDEVIEEVRRHPARHVTVTGGEPLSQKRCLNLLSRLCDDDYVVSLETSGALDVAGVDERVIKVVDLKTPGSGESERNLWSNLSHLNGRDQVKFVVTSREDYDWATGKLAEHRIDEISEVLMSPSYQEVVPSDLAAWMLADGCNARLQLQLHKLLWGDVPGK